MNKNNFYDDKDKKIQYSPQFGLNKPSDYSPFKNYTNGLNSFKQPSK